MNPIGTGFNDSIALVEQMICLIESADQVDNTCLNDGQRPDVADDFGQGLEPATDQEEGDLDPRLRMSMSTLIQNFAPSPPMPAQKP